VFADLLAEAGPGTFDLVFVDADKASYPTYYEQALVQLRPGGLVVLDNTLFFGRVTDPAAQDADTVAIRELNDSLLKDDRVDLSMLVMADGITLARKKEVRS
jgi:O-methyltransferase